MPAADVGTQLLPERQPHLGPQLARVGAAERAVAQDRALAAVVDDDLGPLRSDLAGHDGRQRQLLGQLLEAVVGVEAGAGAADGVGHRRASRPPRSRAPSAPSSPPCGPAPPAPPRTWGRRCACRPPPGPRPTRAERPRGSSETSSETRATPLIGRPPRRDLRGPAGDRHCAAACAARTGFWRPWCLSSSSSSSSSSWGRQRRRPLYQAGLLGGWEQRRTRRTASQRRNRVVIGVEHLGLESCLDQQAGGRVRAAVEIRLGVSACRLEPLPTCCPIDFTSTRRLAIVGVDGQVEPGPASFALPVSWQPEIAHWLA